MEVKGRRRGGWVLLGVGLVALALPALLLPRGRSAKEWIGDLKQGDQEQRIMAAYALRHGEKDHREYTLRALLDIVRSAEPRLQEVARDSARLVAAQEIALLVDLLGEVDADDETVREFCEGVLLNHPEEALELLIAVVDDPHAKARQPAAKLLARFGRPAVEPLSKLLWDEDQNTRLLASWALGTMGAQAQGILGLLRSRVRAPTGLERRTAMQAMLAIDPQHEKTLQLARELLDDKGLETRRTALLGFFEAWVLRLGRERAGQNREAREALGEAFSAALARLLDDFDAHAENGGKAPR